MSRPGLALLLLLAVAIGIALFTASGHHPDLPPAEKEAQDEQQKKDEAAKVQQEKKSAPSAPVPTPAAPSPERAKQFDAVKQGAIRARLEIENRGVMTLELYPKAAPKTVAHITDLIKQNFYEGILVHRVEQPVVQVGDPETKKITSADLQGGAEQAMTKYQAGSHGSGTGNVPLEIKLPHLPYTIGMARTNDPDSGDNQFFINKTDNPMWDSGYCVFGRIVTGQDVVENIQIGDRITHFTLIK